MIKRIIFDLDNTLIMWKNEYLKYTKNVLEKYNIPYDDKLIQKIDNAIDSYEKYYDMCEIDSFLKHINSFANLNLSVNFINDLLIEQGNLFYGDKRLVDIVKRLSSKYDLVVVTNYFTSTQRKRLENMGLLDYFTDVIGADKNKFKPNKEAFINAVDGYQFNECMMIGDDLEIDIKPAIELGMSYLWVTDEENKNYKTIKNIYEIENILL